jgi:hypothetical protein
VALTAHQREVCQLVSKRLLESGEAYVAGGSALNLILEGPRVSRDIDLFHDADEAVLSGWLSDKTVLEENGHRVELLRDVSGFKEALVSKGDAKTLVQWARESAFRFFPLIQHEELGLALHPFDLATNKVLALAGRLEPRDWIDVIQRHDKLQPLGYLVWAACGKDPGFNPQSLLSEARRTGRYSQTELNELSFIGGPPNAAELSRRWRTIMSQASEIADLLPAAEVGACVMEHNRDLCRRSSEQLKSAGASDLLFHRATIRGAYPKVKPA